MLILLYYLLYVVRIVLRSWTKYDTALNFSTSVCIYLVPRSATEQYPVVLPLCYYCWCSVQSTVAGEFCSYVGCLIAVFSVTPLGYYRSFMSPPQDDAATAQVSAGCDPNAASSATAITTRPNQRHGPREGVPSDGSGSSEHRDVPDSRGTTVLYPAKKCMLPARRVNVRRED